MKKIVALLLLFSSPVYALSDCADKPTCEEIGYTHNEYACDQKIAMPCPFDSSKIYCPGPVCEPGYFLYSDDMDIVDVIWSDWNTGGSANR